MTFANPMLLVLGAAMLALPVILHLMMRRKPHLIEFPALRFVRSRHLANQRRLRLRHLLLLILRMGAIGLLALALARPTVKLGGTWGSQEAPVAAALVFDTSPRVDYRQDNRTRLEAAKDFALWLATQFPPESQLAVLDSRPEPPVFQVDRGSAVDRIKRLETSAHTQPLGQAIEDALRLVEQNDKPRKEIYVFTDLTVAAWPASGAARLQERLSKASNTNVYVVDVGAAQPSNYALGDLRLSSQILAQRSSLRVETELYHEGDSAAERTVEMYLVGAQGKPERTGAQVTTPAEGGAHVEFRLSQLPLGLHQGFVRTAGQDGLAVDDTRWFSLEVKPPWKLLLAAPKPAERYALFLAEALAPEAFRKQGRARFECDVAAIDTLANKPLGDYAAVLVLDPGPLTPALWRQLADYTAEGRGLAVFLGRNAKPLDAFNSPLAQAVLPGKLARQVRRPDGDVHLRPRNYQHPILAAFARQAGSIPWDAFPVLRYWELESLIEGASVPVSYSDDRPAIIERPIGGGRALIMTTPVSDRPSDNPWNLLPAGEAWPFVILVNQMASYLVGSAGEQLNYYAGQTAVVHVDRKVPFKAFVVTAPGNVKLNASLDAQRNAVALTTTERLGNYQVQAGGQSGGFNRGFSVNLPAEQTRLARLTDEQLKEMFGSNAYRLVRTEKQLDRAMSTARVGRELFPLLAALLALVLAAEHLVANKFYRDKLEPAT